MASLPDLSQIIQAASAIIDGIDPAAEVRISPAKFDEIISLCNQEFNSDQVYGAGCHTLCFRNTNSQTRYVSVQEFPLLVTLAELERALELYRSALKRIAVDMGYSTPTTGSEIFGKLPSADIENAINTEQFARLFDSIENVLSDEQDGQNMIKFFSEPDWSGLADEKGNVGRKLDRPSDWIDSAVLKSGRMIASANSGRLPLIKVLAKAGIHKEDLVIAPTTVTADVLFATPRLTGGDNILVYGAPGTGKSYNVKKLGEGALEFRTVFHPDMQNSDFVGTLKPSVDDQKNVSYEFQPGTFARALQYADNNPEKRVHLVIEELNRAMAAAVFGELFQLLDRDNDGASEYTVDCPSTEFAKWYGSEQIRLPSNLWIYATMNSADQGVYPLDTAFRRRWKQQYTPIDYSNSPAGNVSVYINGSDPVEILWRDFVRKLNGHLVAQLDIPEDRLVGPRFLTASDLSAGALPGKLLIYLWDDLLRHHGRQKLFLHTIRTYGSLHEHSGNNSQVFSDEFVTFLTDSATIPPLAEQAEFEN